jgi:enoyl-CoA hydratase/carnithine racemase
MMQSEILDQRETLRVSLSGGIATILLTRPEQMNIFNGAQMYDLLAAFDRTDSDARVKAVLLTGEGRAFCAGADLSGGDTAWSGRTDLGDEDDGSKFGCARDGGGRVTLRMFSSLKPIAVAINGAAVGVGATMTLPCDYRVAVAGAKLGFVFNRRGICPDACSSWFLPRVVGITQALDWLMTGRVFLAEEAHRAGLLNAVHAADDLVPAATEWLAEVIENTAPVSTTLGRALFWRMLGASHPMEAHRLESRALDSRAQSSDSIEGVRSFTERRKPVFLDRVPDDLPRFFPWWEEPAYR